MEHKSKGNIMCGGDSLCAEFPDTWEEFVEKWAYDIDIFNKEDKAETAHERVMDVYRVKQMMWYYLGREAETNPKDFGGGKPHE